MVKILVLRSKMQTKAMPYINIIASWVLINNKPNKMQLALLKLTKCSQTLKMETNLQIL